MFEQCIEHTLVNVELLSKILLHYVTMNTCSTLTTSVSINLFLGKPKSLDIVFVNLKILHGKNKFPANSGPRIQKTRT